MKTVYSYRREQEKKLRESALALAHGHLDFSLALQFALPGVCEADAALVIVSPIPVTGCASVAKLIIVQKENALNAALQLHRCPLVCDDPVYLEKTPTIGHALADR